MESQVQGKKKKLPLWIRLIIYMILFVIIHLIVLTLCPNSLSQIFAPICILLGAIFDKDIRKLIFEQFLKRFLPQSAGDPNSSTQTSLSAQTPVNIINNNHVTVPLINTPSCQNETSIPQGRANAPRLADPPIIQQGGKIGISYGQKETHSQVPNLAELHPISTTLSVNPDSIFLFNTPLPHPDELLGRKRDCNTLINRTYKGASTSIVGARRIGKSWLIKYLELVAMDQLGSRFRIGSIDATASSCATIAGFVTSALKDLDVLPSYVDNADLGLTTLERTVRDLTKNQTLVLCIDEFEGLSNRQIFNLSFFRSLRAMAQAGLVLVVASRKPLIDIVGRDGETSGFFNIFEQLTLKPFNIDIARKFAQDKGDQAGFTGGYGTLAMIMGTRH